MEIVKLYPECKDYVWGGEKLKTKYAKKTEKTPCAESWELSFHKDGLTRLADGRTLAEVATERDLGENAKKFPFFPILVKLIDANQNLSVQVHPSDEYALKNENSFGKTEAWYVVEASEGAGLYVGFKKTVTKEEYERAIEEKRLTELLNFFEVKAGECYFIPAGTIHAIAKGCLIYEIQQNSNLTYRVYDYGRKNKNGKERELHVEKALAVTTLEKYEPEALDGNVLAECEYFRAEKLCVKVKTTGFTDEKTFHALTCVRGRGELNGETVVCGDTFFVPANYGEYTLEGDMEIVVASVN